MGFSLQKKLRETYPPPLVKKNAGNRGGAPVAPTYLFEVSALCGREMNLTFVLLHAYNEMQFLIVFFAGCFLVFLPNEGGGRDSFCAL
jgi:hypothetical protein